MRTAIALVSIVGILGCSTAKEYTDKIKVDLPDTVKVGETKDAATCGCNLDKIISMPPAPYTGAYLASRGNAEECPTYCGKDIRLGVVLPNGKAWFIGSLLPLGVTVAGQQATAKCFAKDGQWHFRGVSYGYDDLPKHIITVKPNTAFDLKGTTFTWYEYRQ